MLFASGKQDSVNIVTSTNLTSYNNKLYLNTVATELMCFYKYSKNVYIHIYKLYRKRKTKTLHYRTVSKGPGGPLSSGAWNTD